MVSDQHVSAAEPAASLLLAHTGNSPFRSILLLCPSQLTSSRAFAAIEAGYTVYVGGCEDETQWEKTLLARRKQGQVHVVSFSLEATAEESEWRDWFSTLPAELLQSCMLIALNDTLPFSGSQRRSYASAEAFRKVANERRFLVNVADCPSLSDYTWPVTHRFDLDPKHVSPAKSPLQLAIATNGSSCRLATRLRREIVASLPSSVGAAVAAVSALRKALAAQHNARDYEEDDVDINRPVQQLTRAKSEAIECLRPSDSAGLSPAEVQKARMRYVAQISEYWPIAKLAQVTIENMSQPSTPTSTGPSSPILKPVDSPRHSDLQEPRKGRIFLLGTGPGSPLLLTRLAYLFLTSAPGSPYYVDLFLSDKLVPSEILSLIPEQRRSGVVIAKKYPGNAEHAQDELIRLAIEGASAGKTVLRMKQGDPFLYGRGGEEVLAFREAGFDPIVIPGLSSCIAGPTISGIPVTQRGVAETMVLSTGVGRGGKTVAIDPYERGKTLVVLMGVARLDALVTSLVKHPVNPYPPHLPIALIERASSPDQRVVSATLETVEEVLASIDPHRPPGMLVVGWSVMCLEGTDGKGDVTILDADFDEAKDRERVRGWLGAQGYRVKHGLGDDWREMVNVASRTLVNL